MHVFVLQVDLQTVLFILPNFWNSLCTFKFTQFSVCLIHWWLLPTTKKINKNVRKILSNSHPFPKFRLHCTWWKISPKPSQRIEIFDFPLNSEQITVTLSTENKIKASCRGVKPKKSFSIRQLAQVIEGLVAAFPAVKMGPLYYGELENLKSKALKKNKGSHFPVKRNWRS